MATISLQLLPNNLYLAEQVREIDQAIMATEPVSAFDLMLRAAQAAFGLLVEYWPQAKHICVLAGSGNNGGDAWLVAALAKSTDLKCSYMILLKKACAPVRVNRHRPMLLRRACKLNLLWVRLKHILTL